MKGSTEQQALHYDFAAFIKLKRGDQNARGSIGMY